MGLKIQLKAIFKAYGVNGLISLLVILYNCIKYIYYKTDIFYGLSGKGEGVIVRLPRAVPLIHSRKAEKLNG